MADTTAGKIAYGSVGTTTESAGLTKRWRRVKCRNYHATQLLYASVHTAETSAAAIALADAATPTAAADDVFLIPPGVEVTVHEDNRQKYVALAVIASGSATTYVVTGDNVILG